MKTNCSRTLYVTDLDGTLLTPESTVSDASAEIISDLSGRGALITVATARTPATVEPLLANTLTTVPAIVMTGASLWSRSEKAYVDPALIAPATAQWVRTIMESHRLHPFIYQLPADQIIRAYHPGPMSEVDTDFVNKRSNLPLKKFLIGVQPDMSENNCIILFAMGDPDSVFSAAAQLEAATEFPCSVSAYADPCAGGIGVLEVKAPGTSKAASVQRVAMLCEADRIVVFGDNINDISMMKVADLSVAVGNAVPQVAAIANKVIGTNASDAVAKFIRNDFLSITNND
ncbi:MAG: HAD hydrolase family protein [Muribaculum sp.]|nr:HAD hydrolase family protein [Muribaculaceae bacterium]MCM1080840.1 HAD hydrolase family protein [Muribaculum sp.]